MHFNFHLPTHIQFGEGSIRRLRQAIAPELRRILIVTDQGSFGGSGARAALLDQLSGLAVSIFDEVEANPSLATIQKGTLMARETGAQLVIGIGGGSPMDAAKGIAAFAANTGDMAAFIGGAPLPQKPLPLICIPTTSGTGSEVTPYAIFTDHTQGKKVCFAQPAIFPALALIDPELTYSMPAALSIHTGLDALCHGLEAYLSTQGFPLNDMLALTAMEQVLTHLSAAAQNEPEARTSLSYASMLSGICIAHASTILLHIMAYPLTLFHGIPHGKANAILLPAFMAFMQNRSSVPEKMHSLQRLFEPFGGVAAAIKGWGIDTRLSSYGLDKALFVPYAQQTILKDDIGITPAHISMEDIVEIYNSSW